MSVCLRPALMSAVVAPEPADAAAPAQSEAPTSSSGHPTDKLSLRSASSQGSTPREFQEYDSDSFKKLRLRPSLSEMPAPLMRSTTTVLAKEGRLVAHLESQAHKQYCIIMPWSRALDLWDALSVIFLAYTATILPFRLAFVESNAISTGEFQDPFTVLEFVIDIFFLLDIARNFCTGFIGPGGEVVTDPRQIARQYLRTWFALDAVASFPLEWFLGSAASSASSSTANASDTGTATEAASSLVLLRLAKLGKLVRLLRLFRLSRIYKERSYSSAAGVVRVAIARVLQSDFLFLLKRAVLIFLVIHWRAAAAQTPRAARALIHPLTPLPPSDTCKSARRTRSACLQYLIIGGSDSDVAADAWTERAGVPTDGQFGRRYVMVLSHVQEQLFLGGVGLVPPERDIEFWMLLLTKLVGLMLLAAFFASLASKMVSDQRASSRIYREKVSQLEEWMKTVKLPASFKAKLRAHLEFKYPGGRSFEESRVLDELSPPLRRELCLFQAQDVLSSSQILSAGLASAGLSSALAMVMIRMVFIHGDEIIGEGRRSDGLYIISEGEVAVEQAKRDEDGKLLDETSMLAKLDKGKIFGEMSILNHTGLAQASVTVSSLKLVAFKLSYEAFEKMMSEYPELKTFIERLVRSRNGGSLDFETKRFDAFLSHGPPPPTSRCRHPFSLDAILNSSLGTDWGADEQGRNNHDRVKAINKALQQSGVRTWCDDQQLFGDINKQMADGIDNSSMVICFVTKAYNDKVAGNGPRGDDDNCKYEFDYALLVRAPPAQIRTLRSRWLTETFLVACAQRKEVRNMITVVMEPGMKDKSKWTSSLGGKLAGKMWIDASGDDPAEVIAKRIRERLLESMSEERRKEAEMHEKARHEIVRQAVQAEDLRRSLAPTAPLAPPLPRLQRRASMISTPLKALQRRKSAVY